MDGEDVKRSLGVDPTLTFEACKADVNKGFTLQADAMRNSALLLTDLVNDGVRLLVYAGNAGEPHSVRPWETPRSNSIIVVIGHTQMQCAIIWGMSVGSKNLQMSIMRSSRLRKKNGGSRGRQGARQAWFAPLEGGDQRLVMSRS